MLLMPTHTVTVLTRPSPSRDRQNNLVVDWSGAARTSYQGRVQGSVSTETKNQSDQVITFLDCFLPPTAIVTSADRVEVDGRVYEVDGIPFTYTGWGPLGSLNHVTVTLKEMTG
ncbi:hypothetical protein [Streptomyces sp. CA-106131]|uniref:hypothetical protein n=1 Tax=Streptomyces sp. CA-106131 TaxID=3240045 RepID=UPI003D949FD2